MERLEFSISLQLSLVYLRQDLIVNGPPAVVLKSHVPSIVLVVLRLVEMNVDGLFTHFFFERHVVSGRKCIDVYDCAVREDLVVNEGRELGTTQSEPNVALRSRVKQARFSRINRL